MTKTNRLHRSVRFSNSVWNITIPNVRNGYDCDSRQAFVDLALKEMIERHNEAHGTDFEAE